MAGKDSELRIMETLAYIPTWIPNGGEEIRAVLHRWVQTRGDQQQLSQRISLGGWHPFANASDRALRSARRAMLLAYEYRGVDLAHRFKVSGMIPSTLREKFLEQFKPSELQPVPRAPSLASSFNYATEAESIWALAACNEVPGRLSRVIKALSLARRDQDDKKRFEKWFGKFTENKLALVSRNFQSLASCPKGIRLYYRGKELNNRRSPAPKEVIPPEEGPEGMAIFCINDAGYFAKDAKRDSDPKFCHIFLGALMWGAKVQETGKAGTSVSRCAVIIHELTHCLVGTDDHFYGSADCMRAAASDNDKVLSNASNYQWFSDECA